MLFVCWVFVCEYNWEGLLWGDILIVFVIEGRVGNDKFFCCEKVVVWCDSVVVLIFFIVFFDKYEFCLVFVVLFDVICLDFFVFCVVLVLFGIVFWFIVFFVLLKIFEWFVIFFNLFLSFCIL